MDDVVGVFDFLLDSKEVKPDQVARKARPHWFDGTVL